MESKHLTAKFYIFAPLPTSTKLLGEGSFYQRKTREKGWYPHSNLSNLEDLVYISLASWPGPTRFLFSSRLRGPGLAQPACGAPAAAAQAGGEARFWAVFGDAAAFFFFLCSGVFRGSPILVATNNFHLLKNTFFFLFPLLVLKVVSGSPIQRHSLCRSQRHSLCLFYGELSHPGLKRAPATRKVLY